MSSAYDKCIDNASEWQSELEKELENQGSGDVCTGYANVARAFPSTTPNPHSFDIPKIEEISLMSWAKERGWEVELATEKASKGSEQMPPVRFIKTA
jgi:hypothetical protein